MQSSRADITSGKIRSHYELATLFYRLLWGDHIHHGLWHDNESPQQAQRQLTEHLLNAAAIPRGAAVLDVGCGMGGSSIHLARHHHCLVTGVTLSGLQRAWAGGAAIWRGVGRQARFLRRDAESVVFPDESFDYLWSIECTEHLFDKGAFFQRAVRWLRPGGGVAMCIWLAGDELHAADHIRQVQAVCDAFLCPSLGTEADYVNWLTDAGIENIVTADLTAHVSRTWEICRQRVERFGIRHLARLFGQDMTQFVNHFETILNAYRSGAMKYVSMVGTKPSPAISP